jgi:hypothetical protein
MKEEKKESDMGVRTVEAAWQRVEQEADDRASSSFCRPVLGVSRFLRAHCKVRWRWQRLARAHLTWSRDPGTLYYCCLFGSSLYGSCRRIQHHFLSARAASIAANPQRRDTYGFSLSSSCRYAVPPLIV